MQFTHLKTGSRTLVSLKEVLLPIAQWHNLTTLLTLISQLGIIASINLLLAPTFKPKIVCDTLIREFLKRASKTFFGLFWPSVRCKLPLVYSEFVEPTMVSIKHEISLPFNPMLSVFPVDNSDSWTSKAVVDSILEIAWSVPAEPIKGMQIE